MAAHAKDFSPSSSKRWLNCTASVGLIRKIPEIEETANEAALEGSAAHYVADRILNGEDVRSQLPAFYVPEERDRKGELVHDEYLVLNVSEERFDEERDSIFGPTIQITETMLDHVDRYVDYCLSFKGVHFTEIRLPLSPYIPDGFGTSDHIVIDEVNRVMHVIDLKYGTGIKVFAGDENESEFEDDSDEDEDERTQPVDEELEAFGNTQGWLYAVGAMLQYDGLFCDVERIKIHIYQPRLDHVSTAEMLADQLWTFAEHAKKKAEECDKGPGVFYPAEWTCRWCPAKPACPALAKATLEQAVKEFSSVEETTDTIQMVDANAVELVDPQPLTGEQLAAIKSLAPLMESWLNAVKVRCLDMLVQDPSSVPGFKIVEGRSRRKWVSDAAAKAAMAKVGIEEDAMHKPQSLIGPAQAEKLLPKKKRLLLEDSITKPPGKPTVVLETDPKPRLVIPRGEEFDLIE